MRARDRERIARQTARAIARLRRRGEFIHVDAEGTARFASGRYLTTATLLELLKSGAAVIIQKDLLGEPMQFALPSVRRRVARKRAAA
jgi:cystathionine beta-lyase/cystathionine gamma-synthase